jgi:hypothetical protein
VGPFTLEFLTNLYIFSHRSQSTARFPEPRIFGLSIWFERGDVTRRVREPDLAIHLNSFKKSTFHLLNKQPTHHMATYNPYEQVALRTYHLSLRRIQELEANNSQLKMAMRELTDKLADKNQALDKQLCASYERDRRLIGALSKIVEHYEPNYGHLILQSILEAVKIIQGSISDGIDDYHKGEDNDAGSAKDDEDDTDNTDDADEGYDWNNEDDEDDEDDDDDDDDDE